MSYTLDKEYLQTDFGEWHKYDAQEAAGEFHGGQTSELYKLSSSGGVDSPGGLLSEVEGLAPDSNDDESEQKIAILKAYAEALIEQVEKEANRKLSHMDLEKLTELLEENGIQVYENEKEPELKEALKVNILDGTIDLEILASLEVESGYRWEVEKGGSNDGYVDYATDFGDPKYQAVVHVEHFGGKDNIVYDVVGPDKSKLESEAPSLKVAKQKCEEWYTQQKNHKNTAMAGCPFPDDPEFQVFVEALAKFLDSTDKSDSRQLAGAITDFIGKDYSVVYHGRCEQFGDCE